MSAKIRMIKSNILKNKGTKLFSKTISSKFFHPKKKSKYKNEFTMTKSTKFSDNNITKDIPSSKQSIFDLKSNKNNDDCFSLDLEDFHKNFLLNKNKDNKKYMLYTINNFNTRNNNYLYSPNNDSNTKKVINLKKYPASSSFLKSSTEYQSKIMPLILKNNLNKKYSDNIDKNSFFSSNYVENIFNEDNNSKDNKNLKSFQDNQIKHKMFNIINFKNIENYENNNENFNLKNSKENKNFNIFKTYNSIRNNKNYLNFDFSISKEINKDGINNKKDKNNNKTKIFYGRNNPSLNDKLAYPNYHRSVRIETSQEFFYKTKINILNNYRKYLNQNSYLKNISKKELDIERELIQEKNIKAFKVLFSIEQKTQENYLQFLHKKYRDVQDENGRLIKDKFDIASDIEKIKNKINKGIATLRDGFSKKYFIICVKNHTLSPQNFNIEDFKELENDKLKLSEDYYLNYIKKSRRTKSFRKQSVSNVIFNPFQIRKFQEHSLTKNTNQNPSSKKRSKDLEYLNLVKRKKASVVLKTANFQKKRRVIDSIEEFFDHLDFISSNVYNLIIDNNNKYKRNMYLKLELENVIKNSSDMIAHVNELKNQVSLYENKLEGLKEKNKILLNKLNNLKTHQFERDVKVLLVLQNIHKIYFNIKKEDKNVINITKEMIISYGERYYLKIIEEFFLNILKKVNDIKKIRPNDYNYFRVKLDKIAKKQVFYNFQKLLAEKIQIKVDKVLRKAEKIIYKKYKKTNDYKINPKKHNIIKIEDKKPDFEIFLNFLDDNSD